MMERFLKMKELGVMTFTGIFERYAESADRIQGGIAWQ